MISWSSNSQVLYSVDFETPDQGVNQIVKTGAAPQYVSSINFGTLMVVSAYGALNDQPLLFDSNGQSPLGTGYYYTQIQLNLTGVQAPTLDLAFDFTDLGSGHSFTVLFDTPQVRNFEFFGGQISFQNPTNSSVNIGTYVQGQDCRFDIHLSYPDNQWSFYENGNLLTQGEFNPAGYVQDIRFNYSAAGHNISGTAIDNVLVVIPEPAHLLGVACVTVTAWLFSARKRINLS